ncbi:hypothetical protein K490DRAFT_70959 [Saccharata proteae CBS 121410]|uniref:UBX domain-containing protein n=1 Tax=Saccharata proteae CBS 121410 TaxID=1314787 RepID=A0A9P4I1I1_9PEZI|nr:hypothetical protein K490DRAFT_70959 [Saccharata proteae CBS 121410]
MASHVVVVDSTARRATVKTTPGKHLSDVLAEACGKFGVPADLYMLKFNNKPLDLTRTIRLSNLPQGAKLDLVQGSRSPTAINVALQLETGQRYTQKFASTTPLWQILRIFETTDPSNLNFTQRGIAVTSTAGAGSGAGRLNYEMPVVNIMGRELGSLTELQKTLAQLGFTSGSALLRLRFRDSGMPLEEAMLEISQYFKGLEPATETQTADSRGAHAGNPADTGAPSEAKTETEPEQAAEPPAVAGESNAPEPAEPTEDVLATSEDTTNNTTINESATTSTSTTTPSTNDNTTVGPSSRPTTIYTTPTHSTPLAARQPFQPTDYIPTADHARSHQSVLAHQSKNRRLPSDAELAATEAARLEKLTSPSASVTIRVRLPDQSQIATTFGGLDTGRELYGWVRAMLRFPDSGFALKTLAAAGGAQKGLVTLKEGEQRLIRDLGLRGRVLVSLVWEDGVPVGVRAAPSLRDEWREKGREMEVADTVGEREGEEREGVEEGGTGTEAKGKGKSKMGGEEKESKLMGILGKGLFKKK